MEFSVLERCVCVLCDLHFLILTWLIVWAGGVKVLLGLEF